MTMATQSWGRAHRFQHDVHQPRSAAEVARIVAEPGTPLLAYGLGRSYGDSCLNADGRLLHVRGLDRFIAFDRDAGVLRAEAGVTVADMVNMLADRQGRTMPQWFVPVSAGTSFVTIGGAIANDVHGKNHHRMGSFGCHVRSFRLLRSTGEVKECSSTENAELFYATIGGLGLTGIILDAEIQLRPVPGPAVDNEDIRIPDLATFYELAAESEDPYEYTVAWIDCLAEGDNLGRGLFSRANHVPDLVKMPRVGKPKLRMPLELPFSPLNRFTVAAFNALYWRQFWPRRRRRSTVPVTKILYPLDGIADWNLLYGKGGFYQYQCVVPTSTAPDAVRALLTSVAKAGDGSFLAVLKVLGDRASGGYLSFPMPGTTLALDFPNRGDDTLKLLDRLDAITEEAGGRVYPAKDGRMPGRLFQSSYPQLAAFSAHIDPAFSSSFWRRMDLTPARAAAAA